MNQDSRLDVPSCALPTPDEPAQVYIISPRLVPGVVTVARFISIGIFELRPEFAMTSVNDGATETGTIKSDGIVITCYAFWLLYHLLIMQNKTRRSGLVDPIEIGSECEARCSSTNSVMHS